MPKFWKMNGAGNDFVVLDNRDHSLDLSKDQIAWQQFSLHLRNPIRQKRSKKKKRKSSQTSGDFFVATHEPSRAL